jgi:hypothetical protein
MLPASRPIADAARNVLSVADGRVRVRLFRRHRVGREDDRYGNEHAI